eukprot:9477646-Heterocapsa_arctica.AAC.1
MIRDCGILVLKYLSWTGMSAVTLVNKFVVAIAPEYLILPSLADESHCLIRGLRISGAVEYANHTGGRYFPFSAYLKTTAAAD